jgi:hypothetical protein
MASVAMQGQIRKKEQIDWSVEAPNERICHSTILSAGKGQWEREVKICERERERNWVYGVTTRIRIFNTISDWRRPYAGTRQHKRLARSR